MNEIINALSLILVAQITENGIELGGFLTKFKVQVDDYAETIERFSTLEFSSPKFKLDDGKLNWDAISEAIGSADERAMSYFKTLEDGNGIMNNSSASVQGMSTHLKATGQAFNFAAVKATLLNTALNAGIFLVASLAIEGVANAIDKYVNRAKYAAEAMEEAQQKIDDAQNTLKNMSTTLSENKDRFLELSQGVSKFSENLHLSEEDYAEYLSISNQLAELSPSLVYGYDEQGNALLAIGNNAEETNEKLESLLKTQQATTQQTLIDNMGDVANGVYYEVEGTKTSIENLKNELSSLQQQYKEVGINLASSNGFISFNDDDYSKYGKAMEDALNSAGIEFKKNASSGAYSTEIQLVSFSAEQLQQAQNFYDAWLATETEYYHASENGLKQDILEKEKSLENSYSKMTSNLQAWVKDNYNYQYLSDSASAMVDILVPEIKWNELDEAPVTASDYQNYIENNIIKPLMEVPQEHKQEIDNMFNELLSFEDGDLDVLDFAEQLQLKLNEYGITIDITPIIANEQEIRDKLQNSIETIAKGDDYYTSSGTKVNAKDYEELQNYTKGFTSEQIDLWNKVTLGANNATDAINKFEEAWNSVLNDNDSEEATITFKTAFNAEDFADTKEKLLELAKAGELTPYTLSSTKEYNTLLEQTGLTAEQVYNKIMKIAQTDMTDADWQATLTHARSQITNIQSALDELKENGESSTFVDTIISDYPQLLGYLGNEAEMREQLKALQEEQEDVANKAYQQLVEDSQVYYNTLKTKEAEKLNVANNTINSIIGGNKQLVDVLGKNYKIDLNNYKSIADAKAKLETELIKNSASAWSKFYTVQVNASTGLAEVLGSSTTVPSEYMGSDGDYGKAVSKMVKEQNKQKKNAQDAADAYNTAIASLNNVVKSTSISTGTGGGSGSGAGSATKSTTKFSQAIDWCAQTLSKLSKTIDLYSAKLENNTNSVKTQIKYYKQLLTAQNNVVKGYAKTESKYKSQYTKALKKLSTSDQKKVKNGTYTIEQFSGKAKSGSTSKEEKRYNNIQSALEARDNYLDSQTDLVNAKNQLQEFAEALVSLRWENATEQVEKLNGELELLDLKLSNANGYKAKNEIVDQQLNVQKQIINKQKNAISNTQNDADVYYAKISAKNKKNKNADGTIKTAGVTNQTQLKYIKIYNAYVRQLAEETLELQKAEEEYQSAVNESVITKAENVKAEYDNKISLIDAKENRLNSEIALAEAKGQVASAEYYKLLNANSDERMAQLKEEKTELENQLATLEPYSDAWYEVKQATIEVDEAIAEETVNAVENINKQIEAIEALTKAKNDYLSSTIGTYDLLESLTDTDDYYNEDGSFSDKGMAIVKSKIDKVKLYEQQAKNDQATLAELEKRYANGEIDEATYLNEKIELTEDLQNVTKSMYDEQQSLHDMYIDGLKEESEALQELIDKKMESLNASKAEADYQKSIANKVKNITDLEKQLAMLEGDNSEEARAKRQKVQVQLEEAQQDLEDTQYDKYLERLENSLGDLQDRFDAVIDKLDKQGAIPSIEELSTLVDSNSASVVNGVDKIIKDAGLDSLLGEKGIGYLNDATTSLLTSPVSKVSTKIDTVNTWLGNIYDATVGSTANKDNDSNNVNPTTSTSQTPSVTGGITGTIGVNQLPTPATELTTKMNSQVSLTQRKAKEFIDQNATKAKKKQSEYGILNKKIYEITGGKILSKENRVKLAELLSIGDADNSGDITGAEAKKIVALLENAGFANGGIVEAVHKSGDDGLDTLKVGEAVLTPVQTTAFTKLAENIVPFNNLIGDIVERPNIPMVDRSVGAMTNNTIESVNFEFNLPNVVDSKSLIETIKTDTQVQRTLQNATVGKLNGNTRFGVNRI